MAYNQDNSITIVDTQNWTVKKTLTDEKVTITPNYIALKRKMESSINPLSSIRIDLNIVCALIRNVANL